MKARRYFSALPLFAAVTLSAETPRKVNGTGDYTRFAEDANGAQLQTGVATFRNKDGVTVDLIGAIHIADLAYYQKLNARFTRYEALLYEMVGESFVKRKQWADARRRVDADELRKKEPPKPEAPAKEKPPLKKDATVKERVAAIEDYITHADPRAAKNLPPPTEQDRRDVEESKDEESAGGNVAWLHPLYSTMEKSLGLSGQMRGIDYTKPNFVHADMTLRQFADTQAKKKESFLGLWWKSVQAELKHPEAVPEQPGLLKILEILCSKDSSTELKRVVGRMFGSVDMMLSGMEDDGGTVIVTERNKVALGVLQQQIKAGKKNLGIFYGAAHLPDMEKRLIAMGFERTGHEWFTAWDLPPETKSAKGTAK